MKKLFNWEGVILIAMFVAFCTVALTACSTSTLLTRTVTIDGTKYRSGFYGNLYLNNITFKGDSIKVGVDEFQHVNCDKFDLVHRSIKGTKGMLYCTESQWKKACAYYADGSNFVYYCNIGGRYVDRDTVIATIPNMDSKKFDALMDFAKKNSYDPFGSSKGVKTRRLPIPDRDKSPELIFYKESKDGLFISDKRYIFHVVDGKLLLLFYYDYGHGKYEEMVAVDIPDKLGQYFVKLLCQMKK